MHVHLVIIEIVIHTKQTTVRYEYEWRYNRPKWGGIDQPAHSLPCKPRFVQKWSGNSNRKLHGRLVQYVPLNNKWNSHRKAKHRQNRLS
jgi:hypothetical protein